MIYTKYAFITSSLLALTSANAAPVSWTSVPYEVNGAFGVHLNSGVFNKSGTLLLAENSGGPATTFDSINFKAGRTTFRGGSIAAFHHAGVSPDLSTFGTYGNDDAADIVSLTNLTVGSTYRIQVLVYDGRRAPGIPGRTVSFDGVNQGRYANVIDGVTWGSGLLVTGIFVADATTQDFTIETFDGVKSMGGQLNALLVHKTTVAPEPISAAILSIGGVTLTLKHQQ